ncbi:MAG TPA: C25 family peptidase propeptide domain-containing protein, partial [Polyangiaceae bacterium]
MRMRTMGWFPKLWVLSSFLFACGPVEEEPAEVEQELGHHRPIDAIDASLERLVSSLRTVDHGASFIAASARHAYRHHDVCRAHSELVRLMAELQRVRARKHAHKIDAIDEAFALASSLANGLAERNASRKCPSMAGFGALPTLTLEASDNHRVKARVAFGQPVFATSRELERVFTSIDLPGAVGDESEAEGKPALPTYQRMIAVPSGTTARLASVAFNARPTGLRLLVTPVQGEAPEVDPNDVVPEPDDPQFRRQPFALDAGTYASTATFPAEPCVISPAGRFRGIDLAQVTCTAAQYVP